MHEGDTAGSAADQGAAQGAGGAAVLDGIGKLVAADYSRGVVASAVGAAGLDAEAAHRVAQCSTLSLRTLGPAIQKKHRTAWSHNGR